MTLTTLHCHCVEDQINIEVLSSKDKIKIVICAKLYDQNTLFFYTVRMFSDPGWEFLFFCLFKAENILKNNLRFINSSNTL